jgi:hypothetical protein
MQAHPFDFVSALSGEAQCPVCKEPHAAVDACLCSSCQTQVCADCSRLLPNTNWACAPCVARMPSRAYPPRTGRHAWLRATERKVVAQLLVVAAQLRALPIRGAGPRARLVEQIVVRRRALTARLERAVTWFIHRLHVEAARLRALRVWWARYLRTSPLRAHAVSLVVATVILIAVARADTGPDGR